GAIELAGTFFPADGYVLLQNHGDIHLVCKARYSHSCGWLDGKEIRKDIPDPAPYSAEAMSWHIEATRRDWIGEFIPVSRPPERRASDPVNSSWEIRRRKIRTVRRPKRPARKRFATTGSRQPGWRPARISAPVER